MTHGDVQAWLDRYVEAWRTYDPTRIGDLFSEDVTYRYHPWDAPLRGRTAVVADWLANQDAPGSWQAAYEPLLVADDTAVSHGQTRYVTPDGTVVRAYRNLWVLRFDGDGRCTEFTEWFMKEPAPEAPA